MPTATDVSVELGSVVAWLRAWEGSREAWPDARRESIGILIEVWTFLFEGERIPEGRKGNPEQLASQLKSVRTILEKWDTYDEDQRKEHLPVIRTILANVIAFFTE